MIAVPSFAARVQARELMDAAECTYEFYRACLADLAQVNRVTFGYRPTIAFLERLRRDNTLPGRRIHIVDVGCGYGDALVRIARWAHARGVEVHLTGVDVHPWSIRAAREAHPDLAVEWVACAARDYDAHPDIVVSALFTHHLDDDEVTRFLAWMERRARIGWFVNDLHRHPLPYWGFAALAAAMRWHPYVRHDGPVSIARAFRPDDWRRIVPPGARIERWFPFRLCVARSKADAT